MVLCMSKIESRGSLMKKQETVCCRLNVCVTLKFLCWNSNPLAFRGRLLGDKWIMRVEPPWMGSVPLFKKKKKGSKSSLALAAMRRHSEKTTIYEPGNRPSSDTKADSALDFSAFRTVRNNLLLFVSYLVYGILL